MVKFRLTLILLASMILLPNSKGNSCYAALEKELTDLVNRYDAKIGIAAIIDGTDTIGVNQDKCFPMLSVYKFPIALLMSDSDIEKSITIVSDDLQRDTYSPKLKKYDNIASVAIPITELLAYSLQQSDNNASDIILKYVGGTEAVQRFLDSKGYNGIKIVSTEAEMHADPTLCYQNSATPQSMASLLNDFDRNASGKMSEYIKHLMTTCETGTDRLAVPLAGTGAVFGHKTGTGFPLPEGGIMAINDVGFVKLPNGTRYSIAVFVADSPLSPQKTSEILAQISSIVLSHLL